MMIMSNKSVVATLAIAAIAGIAQFAGAGAAAAGHYETIRQTVTVKISDVVYCTHHLAYPNGYLPLRIQPGASFDNSNKVTDLPYGTCGMIPTGQSVIINDYRWDEVSIDGMTGWVNTYYMH